MILLWTLLTTFTNATETCKFKNWEKGANLSNTLSVLKANDKEDCPEYKQFAARLEQKLGTWLEKKDTSNQKLTIAANFYRYSDGAVAELVSEYLGLAIESNPKLFLTLLKENKIRCTSNILKNYGDYGAMPGAESTKKGENRKQKLLSVTDPSLQDTKKECLTQF